MPHDVTMPQLGMAQDAGKIVSWLKAEGDSVAKGDALFEVETDKAVMEVEAQAAGYLTGVSAAEGADVPVGQVIAQISESADEPAPTATQEQEQPPKSESAADAATLPEGKKITMPQLGMAQDSGVLLDWHKGLGEAVAADDILFEVETDKAAMEVPAGTDGYLAATLAEPGEDVPVGRAVAIISAEKPDAPVARKTEGPSDPVTVSDAPKKDVPAATQAPARAAVPAPAGNPGSGGRILVSPKARRLARARGLDVARLVQAGHPQPYHVADLDVLAALPAGAAATGPSTDTAQHLTAMIVQDGLPAFAEWAAQGYGLKDADALLAGLAGASLSRDGAVTVAVSRHGTSRSFTVPLSRSLSQATEDDNAPVLIIRDLRGTAIQGVQMGAGAAPVLTLTRAGDAGLSITLEAASAQLSADDAIHLLTHFAARMEQPLRHLL